MKLCFDSIEEVKEFVGNLKGTRGGKGKGGDDETGAVAGPQGGAPAPVMPQGVVGGAPAFNPGGPQGGFTPPQGGAPAFNPGGPDPAIAAIVQRINTRIDQAVQSGQSTEAALNWFRGQCGPEAANATLDQIKQTFLFKLPMPSLEQIAKVMNA